MCKIRRFASIVGFLMIFTSISLNADTLDIPALDQIPPNDVGGVPRPVRSMTMDEVEKKFGPPVKVIEPVGDPPITRWIYDKFVVHFEYQYVIDSVVKRQ